MLLTDHIIAPTVEHHKHCTEVDNNCCIFSFRPNMNHSPPSSAQVMNQWIYTSTAHDAFIWSSQQLYLCSLAVPAWRDALNPDDRREVPTGRRPDATLPADGGGCDYLGVRVCGWRLLQPQGAAVQPARTAAGADSNVNRWKEMCHHIGDAPYESQHSEYGHLWLLSWRWRVCVPSKRPHLL